MTALIRRCTAVLAGLLLALCTLIAGGAPGAAQPRDVEVGFYVTSISDISAPDGSFRMAFYIWFNDPAGRFDIDRDLYIDARNADITKIETQAVPTGGTYTYARVEAQVSHEFDFDHFPFDHQTLVLRLEPSTDESDLRFVPDHAESGASPDLHLLGWNVRDLNVLTESRSYNSDFGFFDADEGDVYSQVLLQIEVERNRSPVLIDDFLGFTFAFLITTLSFLVSCTELGLRVGMSTGSLFAAVINLNRLHDSAGFRPEFGLVDKLGFLVLSAIFLALMVAIGTNRLSKKDAVLANRIDSGLGVVLVLGFGTMIFLTLRASLV